MQVVRDGGSITGPAGGHHWQHRGEERFQNPEWREWQTKTKCFLQTLTQPCAPPTPSAQVRGHTLSMHCSNDSNNSLRFHKHLISELRICESPGEEGKINKQIWRLQCAKSALNVTSAITDTWTFVWNWQNSNDKNFIRDNPIKQTWKNVLPLNKERPTVDLIILLFWSWMEACRVRGSKHSI